MHYLITFRCYGTWHHGDARGSVDDDHNAYGEVLLEVNARLERHRQHLMRSQMMLLDAKARGCVARTLQQVAAHRGWSVCAQEVLSNHVHIVLGVPGDASPDKVMSDLKAWATRRLREERIVPPRVPVWSEGGSTRYLWDEEAVRAACYYVEHQFELNSAEPEA